jgi:hypothetical protein
MQMAQTLTKQPMRDAGAGALFAPAVGVATPGVVC